MTADRRSMLSHQGKAGAGSLSMALAFSDVRVRSPGRPCMLSPVLFAALSLALAPDALAATGSVDSSNGRLSYVANSGEANEVTFVRPAGGVFSQSVVITDPGAIVVAGAGCASASEHELLCIGVVDIQIDVGDLDDSVTVLGMLGNPSEASEIDVAKLIPATISGGEGNDSLEGSDAPDTLRGDAGADTISGGSAWFWRHSDDDGDEAAPGLNKLDGGTGDDALSGGFTFDRFVGGEGADSIHGGEGSGFESDVVDYRADDGPVVVTLDGVAGDGAAGENDNVFPDVENVVGTPADDTLIGNSSDNNLDGQGGNDTLLGRGGWDLLDGGGGNDHIRADPGASESRGGPGADVISGSFFDGGAGDDSITGTGGYGRGGNDIITGRAGRDWLEGGPGADVIRGTGSNDFIAGDAGADTLAGGNGRDEIWGDWSFDGGHGNDTIRGGPGPDNVRGQGGNDTFDMRDGFADRVLGNGGADRARIDRALDIVRGVEDLL
jgi:Ca2+-binding RTX toxin-like protein